VRGAARRQACTSDCRVTMSTACVHVAAGERGLSVIVRCADVVPTDDQSECTTVDAVRASVRWCGRKRIVPSLITLATWFLVQLRFGFVDDDVHPGEALHWGAARATQRLWRAFVCRNSLFRCIVSVVVDVSLSTSLSLSLSLSLPRSRRHCDAPGSRTWCRGSAARTLCV
jgi:hypothetical protein